MFNKYLVEFFGTMFFLYIIIATGNAFAIGAALALVIYFVVKLSVGYFNPGVIVCLLIVVKKQKYYLFVFI